MILCGTYAGYRRHQIQGETPCADCRTANATYERRRARRQRPPCAVCRRVHPGRCKPVGERTVTLSVTVSGTLARRLRQLIPWGDRSGFVARVVAAELDRLEEQAA